MDATLLFKTGLSAFYADIFHDISITRVSWTCATTHYCSVVQTIFMVSTFCRVFVNCRGAPLARVFIDMC